MPPISKDILPIAAAFAATFVAGYAATARARRSADVPAPFPGAVVVAELFTSEDCSGCPPADRVLADIVDQSLIPGVQVLGLVEPVDYLGGSQPSSSSAPFTARQSAYDERVFHRGTVRMPQVVVDGQVEAMGDDFGPIQRAVARAARSGKAAVTIDATIAPDTNELHLSATITVPPEVPTFETAQLFVAVTPRHQTPGVRLADRWRFAPKQIPVVRSLLPIGTVPDGLRTWSTEASLPIQPEWKPTELTVVGFLQESKSLRIVGAGSATVSVD